jgi:hypothetical protein
MLNSKHFLKIHSSHFTAEFAALAFSNCRDARCGLLNCKTENGNVAPCALLSRWLLSVLRQPLRVLLRDIIQLNFLNLFSLALFGKMVTPSCIHLRLLNVNFLSGALIDNIVCNLYLILGNFILSCGLKLLFPKMSSLAARTGCTLQNSKCDHIGTFS